MKTNTWIALGAFVFVASFAAATSFNSPNQEAATLSSSKAQSSLSSQKSSVACAPTDQLSAMIATNNPASSVVVIGQLQANFLAITFINGSSTGCTMNASISFQRFGVSVDSDISGLYLFNGNTRLTNAISLSSGVATFNSILIPPGPTTLMLKGDVSNTATGGHTVGFNLTNFIATDASNGNPLNTSTVMISGNLMAIASTGPTLITLPATSITSSSVVLNGSGTWSQQGQPTFYISTTIPNGGVNPLPVLPYQASGNFSYPVNNLLPNTTYYFKAGAWLGFNFVANNVLTFTTLPSPDLIIQNLKWNSNSFTGAMGNQPILRSPTKPYLYFNATIKNNSTTTPAIIPANTKFTLYLGSVSSQNIVGQYTLGSSSSFTIAPNSTKVIQFTSTQSPSLRGTAGTFQLIMEADTANFVQETNEANNTSSYSLTII